MATKPDTMAFLNLGHQKYAMPIKVAQIIQAAMLENTCVAVENLYVPSCGCELYVPIELLVQVEQIKSRTVVCTDVDLIRPMCKKAYTSYIQSKVSLIGDEYRPETYKQYLENKEAIA